MLAPQTTISRYVIETPIGQGGMGAVYRARDTHLDRAVALKVLSHADGTQIDPEARERLVREARAAGALSHPNAVTIFDAGDSEHGPFIVMELVDGETLRKRLEERPTVAQVLNWMKMAAHALGEAHERGIVHRDVKPENLMVRRDGILKVLDFGVARRGASPADPSAPTQAALPTLTGVGVQVGTPQYMAPEQIKGRPLDGRTDQFAWAVTTYEALTGQLPWRGGHNALGLVAAILEEVPEELIILRPDVSPEVSRALARALSKRPEDRFPTMRALVNALEGGEGSEPVPAAVPKRASEPQAVAPRAAAPSAETRYGEATVRAVIGRALEFEERGGYSKDDLAQAAEEIGISEQALEQAARAVSREKRGDQVRLHEDRFRDEIRRKRRRGFLHHLIAYLGVNLIIVLPGLFEAPRDLWAFFIPAIAWGIGLLIHALGAFSSSVSAEELRRALAREEQAIAKDAARRAALAESMERKARRKRMKDDVLKLGSALEEGVASILTDAASKIRQGQAQPRVRVAPDSRWGRRGEQGSVPGGASGASSSDASDREAAAETEARAAEAAQHARRWRR